jgi:hypothetical protein
MIQYVSSELHCFWSWEDSDFFPFIFCRQHAPEEGTVGRCFDQAARCVDVD